MPFPDGQVAVVCEAAPQNFKGMTPIRHHRKPPGAGLCPRGGVGLPPPCPTATPQSVKQVCSQSPARSAVIPAGPPESRSQGRQHAAPPRHIPTVTPAVCL